MSLHFSLLLSEHIQILSDINRKSNSKQNISYIRNKFFKKLFLNTKLDLQYMSALQPLFERNQEATVYVGNIDQKVNEEVLWELFVQCGPVVNIHLPRDKITSDHQVIVNIFIY